MTRITMPTPTRGRSPSHSPPDTRYVPGKSLARGLGWFSIGLGLAELLAPKAVAELTGVRRPMLLQAYGLREIICGVGILRGTRPTGWMWARVAGDALDLATLGEALIEGDDETRLRTWASTAAVAGVTALDVLCSVQFTAVDRLEG